MSSRQKRLDIVLNWIQKNPGIVNNVIGQLTELNNQYDLVRNSLRAQMTPGKQLDDLLARLKMGYEETGIGIIRSAEPGMKLLDDAVKDQVRSYSPLIKQLGIVGNTLNRVGFRMGWLSFRLVIMGRMLTRSMLKPLTSSLKALQQWDTTLGKVAVSMGLMTATGIGSEEALAQMEETLRKLPEVGMQVQAGMGQLQGTLAGIAVDVGPMLASAMSQIAETFMEVWNVLEPTLIPAIQNLVTDVLPQLLDVIQEVAPAFAIGFVEGIGGAIPIVTGLIDTIEPFIPQLGRLLGVITPLAPLFMIIGTAMYFVSPIINLLGSGMQILSKVMTAVSGSSLKLFGHLVPLSPVLVAIAAVVATVVLWWDTLSAAWRDLVAGPLKGLFDALGSLGEALGVNINLMDILRAVTFPLMLALEGLMVWFGAITEALTTIIKVITNVIDKFKGLGDAFKGIQKWSKNVFGGSIHKEIAASMDHSVRSLNKLQKAANATDVSLEMGGGGAMTNTMYTSVTIGAVSGIADLDMVYNTINRAIAESYRRRRTKW